MNMSIEKGSSRQRSQFGFTLIELMITVLIIAILAAISFPSYTQYVTRANRTDAQDKLVEVALQQERFNTRNRTYTEDMTALGYAADPIQSNNGLYTIDASACAGTTIAFCANLTATPVAGGRQVSDGALTLDTRGARTGNWDK